MQDFSWESIWAGIQKEKIELEARSNVNKQVLFDILAKNNVEHLFVAFDGSGDSGGVDTVELSPENLNPLLEETALGFVWKEIHPAAAADDNVILREAIEVMCYDLLRLKHQGWETNEGAFGTFEFDVKNKKVKLTFNERSVAEYVDEL